MILIGFAPSYSAAKEWWAAEGSGRIAAQAARKRETVRFMRVITLRRCITSLHYVATLS
jgi:hypothetical protein